MSRATDDAFSIRVIDVVALLCALTLWVAPMMYRGFTNHPIPGMPRFLSLLQNVSALFSRGVKHWRVDYIQVLPAGSQEWITIPEEDYFQMTPFGHRTRLHELLNRTSRQSGHPLQAEAAAWIRKRYIALHPDLPRPVAVQFIAAQYRVGRDRPAGHWRKPDLASFRPEELFITSTHRFGSSVSDGPGG